MNFIIHHYPRKACPHAINKACVVYTPWLTNEHRKLDGFRENFEVAAIRSKSMLFMDSYKNLRNNMNNLYQELKKGGCFPERIFSSNRSIEETSKVITS